MMASGTYLAPFLKMVKVVEYDKEFKPIWTCEVRTPWAAVRLHNGNTLVTDEHDRLAREVNLKCETVWEFKQADLPAISNTNASLASAGKVGWCARRATMAECRRGFRLQPKLSLSISM